jgi:NADH-quinone oxidoreductase subunit E
VAALRRGEKPLPTRGAPLTDFRGIERQLAGFSQHADDAAARAAVDAPSALGPTLVGLRLAEERGESAPDMPRRSAPAPDTRQPAATVAPSGRTGESPATEAADARVAAADNPAERAGAAQAHPDKGAEYGRDRPPGGREEAGTATPAPSEPAGGYQGPDSGRRIEGSTPPKRKG